MRITISGPPGSGKTTACRKLSEELGIKFVVFGQFFRQLAAERNMTLAEFGALAETDPSIDRMVDDMILDIALKNPDIVLESRLSAHMLQKNNVPAFKVYLFASSDVRMERVGIREGEIFSETCKKTEEREQSEAKRYKMYYDIDIEDKSVYDLVLNTDNLTPDEVVNEILEAVGDRTC
jgi:cytidylate kinase, putative